VIRILVKDVFTELKKAGFKFPYLTLDIIDCIWSGLETTGEISRELEKNRSAIFSIAKRYPHLIKRKKDRKGRLYYRLTKKGKKIGELLNAEVMTW